MVMKVDDPIFLDTNILIYANVRTAPHHSQSFKILEKLWSAQQWQKQPYCHQEKGWAENDNRCGCVE